MSRYLGLEAAPVAHALDDARHEGGAVEHAHLTRYADICVDERVIVGNHVFIRSIGRHGVLEGIGGALEEEAPERAVDEVEEVNDTQGAVWRR